MCDFGHDGVEKKSGVTWMEKSRSFTVQDGVVTSLIVDEVVDFGKSIKGAILYLVSPNGGILEVLTYIVCNSKLLRADIL